MVMMYLTTYIMFSVVANPGPPFMIRYSIHFPP